MLLRMVRYVRQSQHDCCVKKILFTETYVLQLQNKEGWSSFQAWSVYIY